MIIGACENYAVQVISGKIDPSRYLATWSNGDTAYQNIFTVSNRCDFARYGFKQGQEFSFLLSDTAIGQTCAQCDIYIAVPNVGNTITSVQPIP